MSTQHPVHKDLVWTPFLMMTRKEISRFLKVIVQTILTPFVSMFLYLLIFGVGLGSKMQLTGYSSYLGFLIPGLVMMSLLNGAYQNTSSSIITSKFSGDLEDLKVLPITEQQIVWAMSAAGLIRGIVVGLVTYLTGIVFFLFIPSSGNVSFAIARPELVLFYVVVGGLAFSQLGIAIGFFAKSMEQVALFGSFILVPLTYLGGVFVSTQNLSPAWQSISHLNPILYYVEGLRAGVTGVENVDMTLSFVVSLAGLVVFHIMAVTALKRGSFSRW